MEVSIKDRMKSIASARRTEHLSMEDWFDAAVSKGLGKPYATVVHVTPALANFILNYNPSNRNIKETKLSHYASDMKDGKWTFNGESVIISNTGQVNDGQHRMLAVIKSGVSCDFMFVFGVSRESRMTVDQGAARGAGDYLSMDGVKNGNVAASVARIVMAYEKQKGRNIGSAKEFTNSQICERVHNDPAMVKAAAFGASTAKYAYGVLAPSLSGALYYILSKKDATDAEGYLNGLCMGEGISRGDPAHAARSALAKMDRACGTAKRIEMALHGWNAYRRGRRLTIVKSLGNFPPLV